ncbi:hypothetical protein GEMRC1_005087 [Eukaryota sp. GEM-RC1]
MTSHLITAPHLSYSMYLISPNCFHSQAPFTITFTPGKAVELVFVQEYLEIYSYTFNISLPVICVDFIGFIVECTGNLSVVSSSFSFTNFELFRNSLAFSTSSIFSFSHHQVALEFADQYVEFNFQTIQYFAEIVVLDSYAVDECHHQMNFDKSCTLLKP